MAFWMALIAEFAGGLASEAGADSYRRWFGRSDGGVDFSAILREVAEAFRQIVKRAIDQGRLDECVADVNALKTGINEYCNNPELTFRLTDAISFSNVLIARLQSFPDELQPTALGAFAVAASLRLQLLQELAVSYPNERANLRDRCVEYANHVDSMVPRVIALVAARFGISVINRVEPRHIGPPDITRIYLFYFKISYSLDGQSIHDPPQPNVGRFYGRSDEGVTQDAATQRARNEAEQFRVDAINRLTNEVSETQLIPLIDAAATWRAVASRIGGTPEMIADEEERREFALRQREERLRTQEHLQFEKNN